MNTYAEVKTIIIPGILKLEGNKSYGRTEGSTLRAFGSTVGRDGPMVASTTIRASGRLLYQCIPHNKQFPTCLVPYEIPTSFNKSISNKYVLIEIPNTNLDQEITSIQIYKLFETIGDVDDYKAFETYKLHCGALYGAGYSKWAKIVKAKTPLFDPLSLLTKYQIQDLRDRSNIISVDPPGCKDVDDAMSILYDPISRTTTLSIYIANVPIVLDLLGLLDSITDRVTTVYLPAGHKVPMLPPTLSEGACSLLAGELRAAYRMDVIFTVCLNTGNYDLLESKPPEACLIRVSKNHAYEDIDIPDLDLYWKCARALDANLRTETEELNIDTHAIVASFMKHMNTACAKLLLANRVKGIFRNQQHKLLLGNQFEFDFDLVGGSAATYDLTCTGHASLEVAEYTHITSPIRRLVDLLNMMLLQNMFYKSTCQTQLLYDKWLNPHGISIINERSKAAKKAEIACALYYSCLTNPDAHYMGIIINVEEDEKQKQNDIHILIHTVYLESLKTTAKYKSDTMINIGTTGQWRICVFNNESTLHKKVKIVPVF